MSSILIRYIIFMMLALLSNSVEVHFEANDSGFFLKNSRKLLITPEISTTHSSQLPPLKLRTSYNSVLSVDRFTVVQTTQAVSIRASYGPFSTKQTIPAKYIVPDVIENQPDDLNALHKLWEKLTGKKLDVLEVTQSEEGQCQKLNIVLNAVNHNTTAALLKLQQSNIHLDISAHLISTVVSQDSPVLRVLFHAGADPGGHLQRQKICVLLHVSSNSHVPIKGRCMPEGEDGVCVAEVVIPYSWFHSFPVPPSKETSNSTSIKIPQKYVQVSYSVFEPPVRNPELCEPKVQIQPLTNFVQVPLVAPTEPFKEFHVDESLIILLPQQPLYPLSKFHVPVYLQQIPNKNISSFTVKARIKSGIKVIGATSSSDIWNISIERDNSKYSSVRVTAINKKTENNTLPSINNNRVNEIFTWLLEVEDDTNDLIEGGKIVWSVTYVYDNPQDALLELSPEDNKKRIITKLEVNKDDIQAVLPMAKNWELMNTAVLTGRQVAQPMKVFIVSQGGKVADVTLQSSCYAEDESVIKVSSSCSSVYVDGSEIRGSSNASIIAKYGTYIGLGKFVVWMPEFPLEVHVSDFRLSQIKGWKVVEEHQYIHKKSQRKKRSFLTGQFDKSFYNHVVLDKMMCRARYQQSPVEVYAKFLAIDQNSGRISYFISRKTGLRVTDLVQPLLRVADPKVAILKGQILQGKSMGRTDVQVLSPITGRVIGAKEIRVGSDKVSLVKLLVRVVSGLQLTITPDNSIENGYVAETAVTHKLTAQYQEGLLDIDLEFSDGSRTPLRDISVDDYFLLVESLDTEVVAFAPMLASHHPRVIAVGEGNGNLLRVTLLLSEDCRIRRNVILNKQSKYNISPLASALAAVEVDFNSANDIVNKHELVQNDEIYRREKTKLSNNGGDLADIIGIPLRDSSHHEPTIQARQHKGNSHSFSKLHYGTKRIRNMSSLEVGMYVLLTAFCFAIVVFVISCIVYASKFKPPPFGCELDSSNISRNSKSIDLIRESKFLKEPTTNAHDWVWLGRSTMDRSSMLTFSSQDKNIINSRDSRIRITNNPINNYSIKNKTIGKATYNTTNRISCSETNQINKYILPNNSNIHLKSVDYRPPVPPHRNIAVRSKSNHNCSNQSNKSIFVTENILQKGAKEIVNSKKMEPIIDSKNELIFSTNICNFNDINPEVIISEKHNAEKLVECAYHKRNVFQFDTLSTKINVGTCATEGKETVINSLEHKVSLISREESNNFIKPKEEQSYQKNNRVKRATVVGNPMFSSTIDDDINGEESLSLDDLDMDYEQIMHYFDNLKESNA